MSTRLVRGGNRATSTVGEEFGDGTMSLCADSVDELHDAPSVDDEVRPLSPISPARMHLKCVVVDDRLCSNQRRHARRILCSTPVVAQR